MRVRVGGPYVGVSCGHRVCQVQKEVRSYQEVGDHLNSCARRNEKTLPGITKDQQTDHRR